MPSQMKVINGKLLGQSESDLDIFKKYQSQYNLEINTSLEQLGQQMNKAETVLKGEALRELLLRRVENYVQQLEERCNCLEQEQKRLKKVEQRWDYIENTKISQIEKNVQKVKQLIPRKLLWLTFSSSLVVGTISLCNWLDIFPTKERPQEVLYNLSYPALTKSESETNQTDSSNKSISK